MCGVTCGGKWGGGTLFTHLQITNEIMFRKFLVCFSKPFLQKLAATIINLLRLSDMVR